MDIMYISKNGIWRTMTLSSACYTRLWRTESQSITVNKIGICTKGHNVSSCVPCRLLHLLISGNYEMQITEAYLVKCEQNLWRFHGLVEKFYSWSYKNQNFLWTDMTANQNYKTNFNRSSLYQIPTNWLIVSLIREKCIYNPYVSELDFMMNQYDRESEFV
jgi:hypothetical protein